MSYIVNNQQKLNDIIFAKRNKNYGAYAIRSSYGFTVLKSLGFMLLGFSSVICVAWFLSNRNMKPDNGFQPPIKIDDSVYVINYNQDEPKPPEANHDEPRAPEATGATSSSVVVVDSVPPTHVDTLARTPAVENPNTQGNSTVVSTNTGPSTGTNTNVLAGTSPTPNVSGLGEVDKGPEFEGGLDALRRFILSHLKYPAPAYETGSTGTVYVRFVVDEKGNVTDPNVVRQQGYGMDEEAIRVVSMIPKFKSPATKGGEPVKVYYYLPIKFTLH